MSFFIRKGGTGGKNSLVGKKRKANYEGKGKKFKKVILYFKFISVLLYKEFYLRSCVSTFNPESIKHQA